MSRHRKGFTEQEYTTETRIPVGPVSNPEAWNLLTGMKDRYCQMYRLTWHEMTCPDFIKDPPPQSEYITYLTNRFGILKRTANSLYHDVKGRMTAYRELKKTELAQLKQKISALEKEVSSLKKKRDRINKNISPGTADEKLLQKYRACKSSLYWKKNRLNRLRQKRNKLARDIEGNVYNICFGSKNLFRKQWRLEENGYRSHEAWLHDFRRHRDTNLFFLGSADETCGNQMFQLAYNTEDNTFQAAVRKENHFCSSKRKHASKNKTSEEWLVFDGLRFRHLGMELADLCLAHQGRKVSTGFYSVPKQPLTFRLHFEGNKCYLQVMFSVRYPNYQILTRSTFGVIGLDYNDGFIEKAETDASGNLISLEHIVLKYHGCGNKAESEIREVVHGIAEEALLKGKDIVHENLNMSKKKAKQLSAKGKHGKRYNRMLHAFDYSRYIETLKNTCIRMGVGVITVSPACTSKIAKQKYCGHMKLTIHQGAAFVIARRGQGFRDRYSFCRGGKRQQPACSNSKQVEQERAA